VSTTTASPTVATKPRRRLLRLIVRGLLVVVAVIGLYLAYLAYEEWRARREWVEACAEADRLDPGWRWEELIAKMPAVPDEQNSAVRLLAAERLLPQRSPVAPLPPAIATRYRQTPPTQRLSRTVADGLRSALGGIAPAVAESRSVAKYSIGYIPPPPSLSSSLVQSRREVAFEYFHPVKWVLDPLLHVQLEDGDLDEALVTVRAMVYASRPLAESPALLNVVVATAERYIAAMCLERVLAQGEPSPEALDALRRVLEPELERPLFLNAFRGSRAVLEELVRALDEGRITKAEIARAGHLADPWFRGKITGWAALDEWIREVAGTDLRRSTSVAMLRQWNWAIERLKESPDALRAHADEWDRRRAGLPRTAEAMVKMLARCASDFAIDDAYFRAAIVALAAEHFRQVRGRWPEKLGELVPEFVTALPRDPQDLQPLRLARLADGIAIYSIGPDGKDDGGDVGQGMSTNIKGRDIGIRLWDVDKRRQPAPQ
jgi:hypothetical protein